VWKGGCYWTCPRAQVVRLKKVGGKKIEISKYDRRGGKGRRREKDGVIF